MLQKSLLNIAISENVTKKFVNSFNITISENVTKKSANGFNIAISENLTKKSANRSHIWTYGECCKLEVFNVRRRGRDLALT